jgi:hypothetical protein
MTKKILLALTFVSMINVVNQDFAADRRNPQSSGTTRESQSNTPVCCSSDQKIVIGIGVAIGLVTAAAATAAGILASPIYVPLIVFIGVAFIGFLIMGAVR